MAPNLVDIGLVEDIVQQLDLAAIVGLLIVSKGILIMILIDIDKIGLTQGCPGGSWWM